MRGGSRSGQACAFIRFTTAVPAHTSHSARNTTRVSPGPRPTHIIPRITLCRVRISQPSHGSCPRRRDPHSHHRLRTHPPRAGVWSGCTICSRQDLARARFRVAHRLPWLDLARGCKRYASLQRREERSRVHARMRMHMHVALGGPRSSPTCTLARPPSRPGCMRMRNAHHSVHGHQHHTAHPHPASPPHHLSHLTFKYEASARGWLEGGRFERLPCTAHLTAAHSSSLASELQFHRSSLIA